MADFPDTWQFTTGLVASGNTPVLRIAGVPSVIHIIDTFSCELDINNNPAVSFIAIHFRTAIGTISLGQLSSGPVGNVGRDTFSSLGPLGGTISADIFVEFAAPLPANCVGFITAVGHDL